MPQVRKSNSSFSKHHPYLNEEKANEQQQNNRSQKHSSNLRSSSASNHDFIPRSMSVGEESAKSWKLSFCGVLSTSSSQIDKHADSFDESCPMQKSSSCQIPSNSKDESVTPPIPVPMRKGSRKRKSNFRSSGGYFFDKYMKHFQEKYASQRSLCHSETIDELKVSQFNNEMKTEVPVMRLAMRSNREDLVCRQPMPLNSECQQFCCSSLDSLASDDLYPLRFGSSSVWSSLVPNAPWNSTANNHEPDEVCSGANFSSVFPSSPPCFWGDASSERWDEIYAQPVSPVPSISDAAEGSLRYSDSNSETLKAMETLYLCNFKVAVDGDWLCLKEINEESLQPRSLVAYSLKDESVDTVSDEATANAKTSQEMTVERKNLLNMAKLSIKGLIESSLKAGHTLDSDHQPLEQFFIIIEYVLRHGLKTPKNFFIQNKYFWPPLEALEKLCPDACEITNSVRSLPGVRTHLGKGRLSLIHI